MSIHLAKTVIDKVLHLLLRMAHRLRWVGAIAGRERVSLGLACPGLGFPGLSLGFLARDQGPHSPRGLLLGPGALELHGDPCQFGLDCPFACGLGLLRCFAPGITSRAMSANMSAFSLQAEGEPDVPISGSVAGANPDPQKV